MIQLRDYQKDLVFRAETAFEFEYRAPIIVLSTGGGKTVCFSQLALNTDDRVWVLAHRQELIRQASTTLTRFGIPHGIIKSGQPGDLSHRVQVASVQTIVRRLGKVPAPGLIIYDECHHAVNATSAKIFAACPDSRLIGVTATPCRTNGAGLGSVFDVMLLGPSNLWLTENGFLSPARYYAPPQKADLSGIPIRGGDYATAEMEDAMDKPSITGDAVEHYRRICDGAPMLVFCVSVAHAHHVAEQYRAAGYRAAAVDGKLSDEERDDRITGLGTGKYQIITSCDLIGEGLDVPVVTAAQLLRPTASLGLHLQQIGRVLRPADGKEYAIILDHVGNTAKHGFASTPFNWSLEGTVKRKSAAPAVATRTCEQCFSVHRPAPSCPYCGFTYVVKAKALTAMKVVDGVLVEVEQTREERAEEQMSAKSVAELTALAKARGYKKPHFWALKVFRNRSFMHLMPKI